MMPRFWLINNSRNTNTPTLMKALRDNVDDNVFEHKQYVYYKPKIILGVVF